MDDWADAEWIPSDSIVGVIDLQVCLEHIRISVLSAFEPLIGAVQDLITAVRKMFDRYVAPAMEDVAEALESMENDIEQQRWCPVRRIGGKPMTTLHRMYVHHNRNGCRGR